MKTIAAALLVLIFAFGKVLADDESPVEGPDASPEETEEQEQADRTFELVVRGLPSGQGRAWRAAGGIGEMDGVVMRAIDMDRSRIVVSSAERPETTAIREALEGSGVQLIRVVERS